MSEKSEEINIESPEKLESIDNNIKLKKGNRKKILLGGVLTLFIAPIAVFEYQNFRVTSPQQYREASTQELITKETNKTSLVENTSNSLRESELVKTIPFRASISSPSNIPVLTVMNEKTKKYTLSTDVSLGDVLFFEIHSFANKAPLQNLSHKLGYIHNKIFTADSSANISAFVSATGVPTINGSVTLHFNENVKLQYAGYKWYTRKAEVNLKKFTRKKLQNEQHGSFVYQGGVNLGSLPANYTSNFLIKFKAVSANENPK